MANAVEKVGFAAAIKFSEFFCAWAAQLIDTMSTSEALQDGFSWVEYHPLVSSVRKPAYNANEFALALATDFFNTIGR
jgi:hypothetical protein